jgi:hypothetical protein
LALRALNVKIVVMSIYWHFFCKSWETHNHDPPIGNASDISEFIIDYDYSQYVAAFFCLTNK